MKILYLCGHSLDASTGVNQKIREQTGQWIQYGCGVVRFCVNLGQCEMDGRRRDMPSLRVYRFMPAPLHWIVRRMRSIRFLRRLLKEEHFDLIYTRYMPFFPGLFTSLKGIPIVMEINSNDLAETKLTHGLWRYGWNRLTRHLVYKRAGAFVAVSEELRAGIPVRSAKAIVISNGINVAGVQLASSPSSKQPCVVFIGSPDQHWQGIDKIEKLAEWAREIHFHVIGIRGSNQANLTYHGYLAGQAAENVMRECDAGISTLALHRKGMRVAMPLKSRHYLAMGLPVIYAYDDPDIDPDSEFVLQLPNTEDNVLENGGRIVEFVRRVREIPGLRAKVRALANERVDLLPRERTRCAFIRDVVEEHNPSCG